MKYSLITLITLLLGTATLAGTTDSALLPSIPVNLQSAAATAPREKLNRGPNQTMSVSHQGLRVTYQQGQLGANWAQIMTPTAELSNRDFKLGVAPTVMLTQNGKAGVGANISLQLSNLVKVNHTTHLGGIQQHLTIATLAPDAPVSLQLLRVAGKNGVVTRLGPSIKLGANLKVWHGRATDGSGNLTLLTGNLRF